MAKFASLDSLRAIRDWAKEKFQSKLPEVTVQDNGDVLSVVDGEWSKSTPENELPEVTSADNGKVLAVVAGEWEKAEAPDGLPPVQSADNGKVLTVVEGEWAKADVPDELPEVSASDNGKFLGVVNGAWGTAEVNALPAVTAQDNGKVLGVVEGQWAKTEPEDGLPEVTSSDNGKVLSVVEGAWAPAEPAGGSGLPEVTSEDNGDILSVVDGAWAKSEPGYRVETAEGTEIAPEQSVTTALQEPYNAGRITATVPDPLPDSVNVTFNGTSYENVPKHADETLGAEVYGDIAFSEYPFVIVLNSQRSWLFTQAAGTYTVKVATPSVRTVVPTEDFKLAVNNSYMETTETEKVTIPAQSVTTAVPGGYSYAECQITNFTPIGNFDDESTWPDTLHVTFDGTEYDLPRSDLYTPFYGAPELDGGGRDFTTYPLAVGNNVDFVTNEPTCWLETPQAGTYTIEATYTEATTAPTEKFKDAVRQSGGGVLIVTDDGGSLDKTWQEIFDAYTSGTAVVIRKEEFADNGGNGDELYVNYSQAANVSTRTITTQGEETVTYSVDGSAGIRYDSTSADGYPSTNSGSGGGDTE